MAKRSAAGKGRRSERARRRTTILRLGKVLGWQPDEVIAFAQGLTGCRWRRCGCAELDMVLHEQQALLRAVRLKAARRQARSTTGASDASST